MDTVGNKSDSLYRAVENSTVDAVNTSLFARMSALTKPSELGKKRCMIAFDYTIENFYGNRDSPWMHEWTGVHGATGKYSYLTTSIVNKDLRLPVFSIPSPMGKDMPGGGIGHAAENGQYHPRYGSRTVRSRFLLNGTYACSFL